MTAAAWREVVSLSDLVGVAPELCGRPTRSGIACRGRRMTGIMLERDGSTVSYEPAACACHATEEEREEHSRVKADAARQRAEFQLSLPVECWSWEVSAEHRRLAESACACADPEEARSAAWRLLSDWQDGRCAVCGGRAEFTDHDHETGLVRGRLCHSCNTLEGFASLPEGQFDRYREKNPASILGLTIRYYSPFDGWAEPAPPLVDKWKNHPMRGVGL